jgi:hypothetical protein
MTASVGSPQLAVPSHRNVVTDEAGTVVGASCFYPTRGVDQGGVWTVTVASRVCSVYARAGGWDMAAEAEARGLAARMAAHLGRRCEAGYRAGAVCRCAEAAA